METEDSLPYSQQPFKSEALCDIVTCGFYGNELLAPRPIIELENHTLSAVSDCLFNIIADTLHPQPEDATCRVTSDPQKIYLTVTEIKLNKSKSSPCIKKL
jgi:hypothetical protein